MKGNLMCLRILLHIHLASCIGVKLYNRCTVMQSHSPTSLIHLQHKNLPEPMSDSNTCASLASTECRTFESQAAVQSARVVARPYPPTAHHLHLHTYAHTHTHTHTHTYAHLYTPIHTHLHQLVLRMLGIKSADDLRAFAKKQFVKVRYVWGVCVWIVWGGYALCSEVCVVRVGCTLWCA